LDTPIPTLKTKQIENEPEIKKVEQKVEHDEIDLNDIKALINYEQKIINKFNKFKIYLIYIYI